MADKIISAVVEGDRPVFIGGVLYVPGERVPVNLEELGVEELGAKTPGLAPASKSGEDVAIVPIAALAPHAPDPTAPQSIAPGTQPSGTGRLLAPAGEGEPGQSREMAAADADVQDGAVEKTAPKKAAAK